MVATSAVRDSVILVANRVTGIWVPMSTPIHAIDGADVRTGADLLSSMRLLAATPIPRRPSTPITTTVKRVRPLAGYSGSPNAPVHTAPGSGVCGPWRNAVRNLANRGSSADSTRSCLPHALATTGAGRSARGDTKV